MIVELEAEAGLANWRIRMKLKQEFVELTKPCWLQSI
jgi:hypothetical protein